MKSSIANKWLARLTELIPPPKKPIETGSDSELQSIQIELKSNLPTDLLAFVNTYGTGEFRTDEFGNLLTILNPFERGYVSSVRSMAKLLKKLWSEHRFYPEIPGLLPCGTGEGPRDLFYLNSGCEVEWPLVVSLPVAQLAELKLSLPEYLYKLFTGSLDGVVGEIERDWLRQVDGKLRFEKH